jgi:hypothetical protein
MGLAVMAAVLWLGGARVAAAQDAAESAIILGGVEHSAGAQSGLGAGIANSLNAAGNSIRTANTATEAQGQKSSAARPRARTAQAALVSGDPLTGTNAPTYAVAGGASIRVSGGLRPEPGATCIKDCP